MSAVVSANTNGVRPEDIQRVYDKLALSLPLFLSTECGREEAMTLIGALLLHAMELHTSRFPKAKRDALREGVDAKHRANFMRLVGELYDKVERAR